MATEGRKSGREEKKVARAAEEKLPTTAESPTGRV